MRDTFVATLMDIARQDTRVVLMTGDLGFGVLTPFATALPRQFVNVGVAEQNLAGIATGLALSGHIVFTYSIANFPTLRCLEQLRNDACYHSANVKVVAVGGGFSYGALGISHHATEDLAILRSLPGMTVYRPASRLETAAVAHFAYETAGTCYIRLDKSSVDDTTTQGDAIVAGRARTLRTGRDATIIGVGGVLEEAMRAADELAEEQVQCTVISMHTVKPIDRNAILDACRNTPVVLTVEEHTLDGGLGGAVAEVCMDSGVHPDGFRRIGLKSEFSSVVGSQQYLRSRYGMNAKSIADTLRDALRECCPRTGPAAPAPNGSNREP